MSRQNEYEMERGIAQILNNYGPNNVFDFGQLGLMLKTNPGRRVEDIHEDVPEERLADIIRSRVDRYKNRTTGETWDDLSSEDIDVYRPLKVEGSLFPPVFYCENPECRKVHSAQPDHLHILPDDAKCSACGSDLTQLPFVNVCECGKLEQPRPDSECSEHGWNNYRLRKAPGGPGAWRFECRECGEEMGRLSSRCSVCNNMRGPLPSGAGSIFYPQKAVEVDIPKVGVESQDLPSGETWARILIAIYLNENHIADKTIEEQATTEGKADEFQKLVQDYGEEEARKIFSDLGQSLEGVDALTKDTEHILPPDTKQSDDDGKRKLAFSNVGQQLFTFIRSTKGYEGNNEDIEGVRHPKPTSLDALLEDPEFRKRHPQSGRYRSQLTKSHVRQAWVVDQFPLLNILYGYTRADPDASNVDLNSFPHPRERASIPVFADRTPSEAIVFEIDRAAIVNWLVANEVITEDEKPDVTDEKALKSWFLDNIATTHLSNPFTPIDHDITNAVYRLLHTFSHSLLARAGEQAGLSTESLSERILPVVPSIVIYAASTENFALGSMFTLFKTRLYPWVTDARDVAKRCLLDPVCRDDPEGAACDACIHISEISCEAMNRELDRLLLVGGQDTVGFWDDQIDNGIDPETFPDEWYGNDDVI